MRKILLAGTFFCSLFMAQFGFAQDNAAGAGAAQDEHYWSQDGKSWTPGQCTVQGYDSPREEHACEDKPTGECYCLYCHYEPCYYYTKRCVTDNKYVQKKCSRQVPKYYEVQRCKMVPQYYTETACKYETECYYVQECVPTKRWVSDRHVKYVPRYYYKHVCGQPAQEQAPACDTAPACSPCGR